VFPLLHDYGVHCVQGNYDESVGNQLDDCQCGYRDPRDNYFAQISYDYTLQNTSETNRRFMRGLPRRLVIEPGHQRVLLCHGSPRRVNEFLWESTTPTHFLQKMTHDFEADWIVATHTGIKWHRPLAGGRGFVNVGVLGRPENDGTTHVWFTLLNCSKAGIQPEFVPVQYDHRRLAHEMANEGLPDEFQQTILTGWWTTCLEILPAKERRKGRF
jgi:diadenosine tetraphosphatase ApaH/serine/threonine PP2A family protein phosphatase